MFLFGIALLVLALLSLLVAVHRVRRFQKRWSNPAQSVVNRRLFAVRFYRPFP